MSAVSKRTEARPGRRRRNLLTAEQVSVVDYKDVDLLRKFISDRGKIRARRVTGLSPAQQKQVAQAIKNAREMALLPYPSRTR
ncbi:30S ribosomal protein S18 [Amycolatopsis viridis]|uniref:Small ribosomal subunit protein bS18 n=1 Tax=Amycolatopsis viridis TaxID=185678 RepID=A0ABX0SWJ5_9PSEU|nr:30S ribosomal protein S18 [Amycolatopsis viridis]NIH80908.1 small subunit ribosomal protein S18 [Amycolatopsis viridis]